MKNVLIIIIILGLSALAWYFLNQPIGDSKTASNQVTEKKETLDPSRKKTIDKIIKEAPQSRDETIPPTATNAKSVATSDNRLTHYYDYRTKENLSINVVNSPTLARMMGKKPKKYTYRGKRAPRGWETDFYNLFLNANEDENVLDEMVAQFQRQARELGATPVELAIAYVQGGIAYDSEKAKYDEFLLQYPYETVFRKKGVCADKTILLSKLLTLMDYKHVLFEFPRAQHMALGLKVPSKYDNFNSGYAFVETTNYVNIGEIPDNYEQGIRINEKPKLIYPKHNGKRTFIQMGNYAKQQAKLQSEYGDAFRYGTTRQKQIAVQINDLEKKIEKLEKEHDRRKCAKATVKTEVEFQKCKKITDDINKMVDEFNALRKAFNKAAAK